MNRKLVFVNNLIWIKTEVTCHKISRFKPFHLGFNTGFISSSFCWFSRWVVVHTSVKCGPKTYGCQIACKVSELWHEHLLTQLKLPGECLYDLSFILAHWAQGAENESHKPSTGSVKKNTALTTTKHNCFNQMVKFLHTGHGHLKGWNTPKCGWFFSEVKA